MRVAGVTVLYNPGIEVIDKIKSYINQIEFLYIVSNSERKLTEEFNAIILSPKIKVFENLKNLGIASALNQAARHAINDGFDLLLTMDQDSEVSEKMVDLMMKEFENDQSIGILSPYIIHEKNPRLPEKYSKEEVKIAITSGSIIKLTAFKEIGGFLDKLFIDYVDYEYSLRVVSKGFKIFQLNNVFVFHNLGNITERKFFFKKVYTTNHSPDRLYYRTRNRFYVYKLYQDQFLNLLRNDKINFIREIIKILLFEEKKIYKFYMILRGFYHYKKNKFGPLYIF